jgi:hypothetical protein
MGTNDTSDHQTGAQPDISHKRRQLIAAEVRGDTRRAESLRREIDDLTGSAPAGE